MQFFFDKIMATATLNMIKGVVLGERNQRAIRQVIYAATRRPVDFNYNKFIRRRCSMFDGV